MSYEVLYRKFRPSGFDQLVGQEHVRSALEHGLDNGRIHHAYLFTGTRGVGKTTIARILARCLNCEVGVTSRPCGECDTCKEILTGRFMDLLEIDAASHTGVDDVRELIENAQYAPTRGRHKVYLIDEVHMLSTSAFNALLKTLEEPPPSVVFVLATTDPKRLPVTVLSRCLQFSLKNLLPEVIAGHLAEVAEAEGIEAEPGALRLLARAGQGSMRDALSLTDQAISHGRGALTEQAVSSMLGTVDQNELARLARALVAEDGNALLAVTKDLAEHGADFEEVLKRLTGLWHEVAVAQQIPDADRALYDDPDLIAELAAALPAEAIQLFYQIALTSTRELAWAPDPVVGFEMALLRMLAFAPAESMPGGGSAGNAGAQQGAQQADAHGAQAAPAGAPVRGARRQGQQTGAHNRRTREAPPTGTATSAIPRSAPVAAARPHRTDSPSAPPLDEAPWPEETDWAPIDTGSSDRRARTGSPPSGPTPASRREARAPAESARSSAQSPSAPDPGPHRETPSSVNNPSAGPVAAASDQEAVTVDQAPDQARWYLAADDLPLSGVARTLARQCALIEATDEHWVLGLNPDQATLLSDTHRTAIVEALSATLPALDGVAARSAHLVVRRVQIETPSARDQRLVEERRQAAIAGLEEDSVVRSLIDNFNATLDRDSVRPR